MSAESVAPLRMFPNKTDTPSHLHLPIKSRGNVIMLQSNFPIHFTQHLCDVFLIILTFPNTMGTTVFSFKQSLASIKHTKEDKYVSLLKK